LKTPSSPHPCSSSPISERSGFADSGLAGPGEPEEDRDVAFLPHVRRAVHREDAREWQAIVHQREDRLLDLACIEAAADQHLLARRVQHDERPGARPVGLGIRLEARRVQDERLRLEVA